MQEASGIKSNRKQKEEIGKGKRLKVGTSGEDNLKKLRAKIENEKVTG